MSQRSWQPGVWLAVAVCLAGGIAYFTLGRSGGPQSRMQFTDATTDAGITFRHTDGDSGRYYLPEACTGGLVLFDYDGDGYLDVYFTNGASLEKAAADEDAANALYRNLGGLRFVDVTEEAGVGDTGFGLGATVGDFDDDGNPDLFVCNFGPNVLYRNNGDGTFSDVTQEAGVGDGERLDLAASFLDADGDGDLDLFVAGYVDFSCDKHVTKTVDGSPVYRTALDYDPLPNLLYRNNGDGTFTDVSAESAIASPAGAARGVLTSDYDRDGDADILVVNDDMPNHIFQNDGGGKFEEVGLARGLAYDSDGMESRNRGLDSADCDNDGWCDVFVTSGAGEWPTLYRNVDGNTFQDVTFLAGTAASTLPHATWGTGFADFDNDGDRDLFIACGDLPTQGNASLAPPEANVPNVLLMNTGDGKFVDVTGKSGGGLSVSASSRGAAFGDLDNDGDVDVVILNSRQIPTVLRNDSPHTNHWIQVRLKATKANRDGVGAGVRITAGDLIQTDEVRSGRGCQSHWGTRLHFGLGEHARVQRIEVFWPDGQLDVLEDVAVDQMVTITKTEEGTTAARLDRHDSPLSYLQPVGRQWR